MLAIAAVGIAVLAWNAYTFVASPAWSYPDEMRSYYCGEGTGDAVKSLWLPWFTLGVVAFIAWAWRRSCEADGNGSRLIRRLARLGLLSVALTCPLWALVGIGADCGL